MRTCKYPRAHFFKFSQMLDHSQISLLCHLASMPISLRYRFDPLALSPRMQKIFTKLPLNLATMPHRRVLLYNCSKETKTLHLCVMYSLKISNSALNYEEASTDACFFRKSHELKPIACLHSTELPSSLLRQLNVLYPH